MQKYRVGDIVAFLPTIRTRMNPTAGAFKIVSMMPREDSQDEAAYRIKSALGTLERVAKEGELTLCD